MTVHVDPRERFTEAAADYARYRPDYPSEAIDWIVAAAALAPGARIVDLGCGTGIATRIFAARGFDLVGIDPNEEMLSHARRQGGAAYLRGESTATGLPDASADLAISAQAFHWFDVGATLVELARVLRPPRRANAFWNIRSDGPVMDAYDQILVEHSTEYRRKFGEDTRAVIRAAAGTGVGVIDAREAEFPRVERLDWEQFWGRVRSSSYIVHGVEKKAALEEALRRFFAHHAEEGLLAWSARTEIISFRVAAS